MRDEAATYVVRCILRRRAKKGTLTHHLSRSHDALEAAEDISRGWVQRVSDSPKRVQRVDGGAKRGLVRRRRADTYDPEVAKRDSKLPPLDVRLVKPAQMNIGIGWGMHRNRHREGSTHVARI